MRYYLDRIRSHPRSAVLAAALDLRYAGRLLHGDEPSRFSHLGARAVHHTSYDILDLVLAVAPPDPQDVLVDVGSGKGRVIIQWLHHACGRRLVGLELDPEIAARTSRQFKRFPSVQIIAGDAIANLPADGTYFYLYNPFTEEKARQLENRLSDLPDEQHVRIVYYNPNFLYVFGGDRWTREVVDLNGRLDRGTLKRFCFPVAVLDRRPRASGPASRVDV